MELEDEFLKFSIDRFQFLKKQAEDSIAQINEDEKLYWSPDNESNSVAILAKHITGNIRSRWTDIFNTDGEKPDRNRPGEFDVNYKPTRDQLMALWDESWQVLFSTLIGLHPEDITKNIYIRKEPHSVMKAILRQLTHYAVHVGQITFLAKHISSENWQTLSIPRNKEVFDYKNLKSNK